MTGLPISVPQELETTALGAALLAGVASGLFANVREAADATVKIAATIEPATSHRQAYDEAYTLYREVYAVLQEPFRKGARR